MKKAPSPQTKRGIAPPASPPDVKYERKQRSNRRYPKNMKTTFTIYIPGENFPISATALANSVKDLDINLTYSEMMRHRIAGNASAECKDVYYICTDENNNLISRLWMGWGRHERAVGNWGNFFTRPEFRGQGIGRQMLDFWFSDMMTRKELPKALFCTAGDEGLARLYAPYGFRPALKDATCGPLYLPLGDSPETFEEFCREYYKPARSLAFKRATLEWRHEIDCVFKFAMMSANLDYLPKCIDSLESALLGAERDNTEIIFTDTNIPVGIAHTTNERKDTKLHPNYLHLI